MSCTIRVKFRSTPNLAAFREMLRSSKESESTVMVGCLGLKTVNAKMRMKITSRIRESNTAMQMFRRFRLRAAILGLVLDSLVF